MEGKVDFFVAGVGTGGTISGTTRYLKQEKGLDVKAIAVEPVDSPVITQTLAGEEVKPGNGMMQSAETTDLSGSEFIAGVNFSLFF